MYQRIDEVAETIKLANMKVRALREALQHVANYDIDDKDYYYPNLAKNTSIINFNFPYWKPWNMKKCIFPRDAQF